MYWIDAASVATYAWAYVKARLTGKSPFQIASISAVGHEYLRQHRTARKNQSVLMF
jgi:hypothetical protein